MTDGLLYPSHVPGTDLGPQINSGELTRSPLERQKTGNKEVISDNEVPRRNHSKVIDSRMSGGKSNHSLFRQGIFEERRRGGGA